MKRLLSLSLLLSTPVLAADYRACKELFVSPLVGSAHVLKADATPRDQSSMVLELRATPLKGKKGREVVIGPRIEHTASPAWNSLMLDETSQGAWLPLKGGDPLQISLVDQDDTMSDWKIQYTVKVPKEIATKGVSFVVASMEGGYQLYLRISATDGRRPCKGVKAVGPLVYELPKTLFLAKADPALFAKLAQYNHCSEKSASAACDAANYLAVYADSNDDGVPDITLTGGPFDGGKAKMMALTLGFEPQKRQDVFVGACDGIRDLGPLEMACRLDDKLTIISLENGKAGARPATEQEKAKELAALREEANEQKTQEARANLKAAYVAERLFFAERDTYSDNATVLGFEPARGNRYAYFLAARGVLQKRDAEQLAQQPIINIISPDTYKHPKVVVPTGLKEAGCPLTLGADEKGRPVGLGLSGVAPAQHFILYAIGNVDEDAGPDCWSISDVERKGKDGESIAAGTPFHELSD